MLLATLHAEPLSYPNMFGLNTQTAKLLPPRFLLVAIGVAGFLLQFLLTEGLQREKAGRATNLIVRLSLPFLPE